MVKILGGKDACEAIAKKLKKQIESFPIVPTLAIIQIGDLEESSAYIKQKKIFADMINARVRHIKLDENVSQVDLINEIQRLNVDDEVRGIIVQLPISEHLNKTEVIETINPAKDVDGLTSVNFRLLEEGSNSGLIPATAKGIVNLLNFYNINPSGKNVVVMGRSMLVGKPTALTLHNRGAKVIVVHSKTEKAQDVTKQADILVVAIGKPQYVDSKYVHEGQIVIDIGINFEDTKLQEEISDDNKKRKIVGDVNFEDVKDIVEAISPVPGGVGLMTVAALFENLVQAL